MSDIDLPIMVTLLTPEVVQDNVFVNTVNFGMYAVQIFQSFTNFAQIYNTKMSA